MTRVLFVDDDPFVLEGLRRGLRAMRKVWDMAFFTRAEDALADIARCPLDVVVSDLRMPDLNGTDFLARVAALHPGAVRIVLSAQTDEAGAIRAASVAHRFLGKPCDVKTLQSVITGALTLRDSLAPDNVRSLIGGVESLPSLPRSYVTLNRALADGLASMNTVARIIEADPGVAAKILQLVNSSFFGFPRKVSNIAQAASYLGIATMKSLVLANALFHVLGDGDPAVAEREQQRALLRARIARRLFTEPAKAEAAATAALLLHVGTLTLQSRLPAEHATNLSEAERRQVAIHEVERERLGVTHAEVGAYLLGLWGLPAEILEAVASHHDSLDDATALGVRDAVNIAEGVASEFLSCPGDAPAAPLSAELLGRLGILEVVTRLRDEIPSMIAGGVR